MALPYLLYGDVTVAADYRRRVAVQTQWFVTTVPRLPDVVFACRGSVPRKCREFLLLYRDCRGFRLLRKSTVQMPRLLITVPLLPWFSFTAEACRTNTVIASNRAMIYRISIFCRGQPRKLLGALFRSLKPEYTIRPPPPPPPPTEKKNIDNLTTVTKVKHPAARAPSDSYPILIGKPICLSLTS